MTGRWRAGAPTAAGLLAGIVVLSGCSSLTEDTGEPPGAPQAGQELLREYGCLACHQVPGVPGPQGSVGPPLGGIADRRTIAGSLPNTPDNLALWILAPQEINPDTLMPDVGVTVEDVDDIVAYLYTLEHP
ncbi:c-type cytochrome [Blastococcus capsensis]|uniref:c-type cytochrome n=1 Tax=Blastococcus capsensis TaxID=1564163 RepID=UPI0025407D6E|nr:c-type cytochrome [Blastococcus capsensis]MDK3257580.1 c-type cytochrome [Blastococcus capsensis]